MTVCWNGNAAGRNAPKPPGVTLGVTKKPSENSAVTPVTPVTAPRGVYMSVPVNEGGTSTQGSMCAYHRYNRYTPLSLSIYLIEKERKREGNGSGNGEVTPALTALPSSTTPAPLPSRPVPAPALAAGGVS